MDKRKHSPFLPLGRCSRGSLPTPRYVVSAPRTHLSSGLPSPALPPRPPGAQPPSGARLRSAAGHHSPLGSPPQPWPHPLGLRCPPPACKPCLRAGEPEGSPSAAPPSRAPGWRLSTGPGGATQPRELHPPSTAPLPSLPLLVLPTSQHCSRCWTKPQSHPLVSFLSPTSISLKSKPAERLASSPPPPPASTTSRLDGPGGSAPALRPLLREGGQHMGLRHALLQTTGFPQLVDSKLPIVAALAPFDLTPEISASPQTTSPCAHSLQPCWPRCGFLNAPSGTLT